MIQILLVFIGGGAGSLCRYGIAHALRFSAWDFPLATFLANVISCVVLGLLVGWSLRAELGTQTRLLLMTGFCGGFSTFSTFSNDTFGLMQSGQYGLALLNVGSSILGGIICLFLGIRMAM